MQFDSPNHPIKVVRDSRDSFKAHVLETLETCDFAVLAEEFNDEAKTFWRVVETTLERIAKTNGIEHRFCEATTLEKKENGFDDSDSDKREQFWLSRILDCKEKNVLFVCGNDHFESFTQKCSMAGFDVRNGVRLTINEWEELASYGL